MKVASEAPARATIPPDGAGPAEETSPTRWAIAAAALVIVAGIVLRFATRSDLWLDEALSVNISRLPYGDIPEWLRHDGAPPLYYFMLHAWTDVFGTTDFAVRSLSGILSVATFVSMCVAVRGRVRLRDTHVLPRDAARDGRIPRRPATPRTTVPRPPGRRRADHRPAAVHALLVLLPDRCGRGAAGLAGVAGVGRRPTPCRPGGARRARRGCDHVPAVDPDLPLPVAAHRNPVGRPDLHDGVLRVCVTGLRGRRAFGGVRPSGRPDHVDDRRRVRARHRSVPHRARRTDASGRPSRDADLGGHALAGRRVRVRDARDVCRP